MKKTLTAVVLAVLCGIAPKCAYAINDGVPSTGSFTIVSIATLNDATATGSLSVLSVAESTGISITVGKVILKEGRDWRAGASTMTAAASLVAAINAADVPVSASYTVGVTGIPLTADYPGALYNGIGLKTTKAGGTSVSGATLTGGRDNASISINAIPLVQGRDWFVQDVASNTAINLAAGINHNAKTSQLVSATWLGGASTVVYLRSLLSPVAYTLSDTAGSAITEATPTMTGGSAGNITPDLCFLGSVNALPTSNYPAGCMLYLKSDPTKLYISTQAVTGAAEAAANSWLAK